MYMIFFVLNDTEKLEEVLEAWNNVGVGGMTVLASTGLGRIKKYSALRDDIPLIPSLEDLLSHEEVLNRTVITLVHGEEMVDAIVDATQKITGDLNQPNTGVLAVIPVARLYGV
ncbi:MAG: P-II family nitrogen regulator [Anaerolineaceae bacterium]